MFCAGEIPAPAGECSLWSRCLPFPCLKFIKNPKPTPTVWNTKAPELRLWRQIPSQSMAQKGEFRGLCCCWHLISFGKWGFNGWYLTLAHIPWSLKPPGEKQCLINLLFKLPSWAPFLQFFSLSHGLFSLMFHHSSLHHPATVGMFQLPAKTAFIL